MSLVSGRRVAVIGGTGFIGSHLTERLVREGADVLAVARSTSHVARLAGVRGDCVIGLADVCDADAMIRLFRRFRPEIVYHLAAHPDAAESFGHVAECVRVNGTGLVNALQAAAVANAEVFVYGGSAKDYGNAPVPYRAAQPANPICSYAILKTAGWNLCQLVTSFTRLKTVGLRPTFVYGPRQSYNVLTYVRDCALAGRPVRLQGGTQTRDPLFVDDAVSAFVEVAVTPQAWGHAIPIGGGQEITVTALCQSALAALGSDVPVVAGAEQSRVTEIWRSTTDNADAERLIGWRPRVSLEEGLSRTVADWARRETPAVGRPVISPRPGYFLHAAAPGVVYQMLDRRDGGDRRGTARGGRRAEDLILIGAADALAQGRIGEAV